jgi:glycosyltransferase involved in cell wall biosynthesis
VPESVTCATILAVRNEVLHLRRAIRSFVDSGIDVVIIDHASTDGTLEICKEYLGNGILSIEHLEWRGVFDLSEQLDFKAQIIGELPHDWIIHSDADEWLQSPVEGESLLEGIIRVDGLGYNAINFDEFVFLPDPDESDIFPDYEKKFLYYYYFAPQQKRLMRAWKKNCGFSNNAAGGHKLGGIGLNLAPHAFILRHYIALSQAHALKKYLGREFSDRDLKKGWHNNRVEINEENLKLPGTVGLKQLSRWVAVDFDRSDPKNKHYWEWR